MSLKKKVTNQLSACLDRRHDSQNYIESPQFWQKLHFDKKKSLCLELIIIIWNKHYNNKIPFVAIPFEIKFQFSSVGKDNVSKVRGSNSDHQQKKPQF